MALPTRSFMSTNPANVSSFIVQEHMRLSHQGWKRVHGSIIKAHYGVSQQQVRDEINRCVTCLQATPIKKKSRIQPIASNDVMERVVIDLKEYEMFIDENDGYEFHS